MKIYKREELIQQGKSIHIFKSTSLHAPLHTHEFIELIYVLSGRAEEYVDDLHYTAEAGDIIFIHQGSRHSFSADSDYAYMNICFSPENLTEAVLTPTNAFSLLSLAAFNEMRSDAASGKISFPPEERPEIENILTAMRAEEKNGLPSWDTVMENYLNILMTKMLRRYRLPLPEEELDDMWQELADYIDANLNTKLTLSDLAQKCFYNPSYFSRIFKEKFGMSPFEYIQRKRVDSATRLLQESTLSVDEISLRVGFSDRSGFYHAFSKYVGCAPADYRKNAKK